MDRLDLRKLSRTELLELLLEQTRRVEDLEAELEAANKKLEERTIHVKEAGNIADAAMELNGVFAAAQAAADQYQENVRLMAEAQKEELAKEEASMKVRLARMEEDAAIRCEKMVEQAKIQSRSYWTDVRGKLEEFYDAHEGLKEILSRPLDPSKLLETPSEAGQPEEKDVINVSAASVVEVAVTEIDPEDIADEHVTGEGSVDVSAESGIDDFAAETAAEDIRIFDVVKTVDDEKVSVEESSEGPTTRQKFEEAVDWLDDEDEKTAVDEAAELSESLERLTEKVNEQTENREEEIYATLASIERVIDAKLTAEESDAAGDLKITLDLDSWQESDGKLSDAKAEAEDFLDEEDDADSFEEMEPIRMKNLPNPYDDDAWDLPTAESLFKRY